MKEKDQIRAINHLLDNSGIREHFWLDENTADVKFVNNCGHLSGGEQLLVKIAYSIWNQDLDVNLWEILGRLDSDNFRRFTDALMMARGLKP